MPLRRKIFRIEEMQLSNAHGCAHDGDTGEHRQDILRELKALRHLVECRPDEIDRPAASGIGADGLRQLKAETDNIHRAIAHTKQEIATLHMSGFNGAGYARVFRELDAVVGDAERAIGKVLAAAEDIDETANTLSAILKREQDKSLAQDIREHVIHIFEACNFHDLAGQRIGKVVETLRFVEERIARMMAIWGGIDACRDYAAAADRGRVAATVPVNGPQLAGDPGHASQADIDALFDSGRSRDR
jgi:chemotaxis protein CheZ